ncbi:MAG: hypothetical protein Q9226_005160 [Calogaya cf. arnoldii]
MPVIEQLSLRSIRLHVRKACMQHVFERGYGVALTQGPRVPTWSQVNGALDKLTESDEMLRELRKYWKQLGSVQVWNPAVEVGSDAAKRAPGAPVTYPKAYYASVEEHQDKVFLPTVGNSGRRPATNAGPSGFAGDYAPDWELGDDRMPSPGSSFWNPVNFDDFARNREDVRNRTGGIPQTPRKTARKPPFGPPSSKPPTPQRRRMVPKGVLFGEWKLSFHGGLQVRSLRNCIYGSRDSLGRILLRVSKEDLEGNVVLGGCFRANATACKYENVLLLGEFYRLDEEQMKAKIAGRLSDTA